jgi:hypothetical protein
MKKVAGKRARWKEVLVGKMRIFRWQLLVELIGFKEDENGRPLFRERPLG